MPFSSPSLSPRLWARVSLSAIQRNFQTLKNRLPAETALSAVIKSDAYGHGMVEVARAVYEAGCKHLVVFFMEEAALLRAQGFNDCNIITVGPGEPGQASEVVGLNLSTSIGCLETARALDAAAREQNALARVHLKMDTGMGRFGFRVDAGTLPPILDELVQLKNVCIEGVLTHLSEADEPSSSFTREQLQRFRDALDMLAERGIHPRWIHAANSAGIVHFPEAAFTLARAGIALYGVNPGPALADLQLEPVMSLGCRIAETREAPAGTPISYGRTCVTTRPTRLALLPVGYGNGYPRAVSGRGACALVHGRRAPFLGRVTMNTIVADITDIPEAQAGDTALMFGRDGNAFLPVGEMAQLAGMIPYEVLCNVGRCAPRFFEE